MNRPDLPADTLQKNNLFFRQLLFLGILITIGLVILKQLGFFVGAFLGASTLYVVLRPLPCLCYARRSCCWDSAF